MFVNTLFMNVLSMSLAATFSFVLILFARKFLDKKVDVFKKSLLWIIFIIFLLFPINFSSRLSIKNLISEDSTTFKMITDNIASYKQFKEDVLLSDEEGLKTEDKSVFSIFYLISFFWIIGTIILISKDTYCYIKISDFDSFSVPEFLLKIFEEQKRKLNINKDVKLMIQDSVRTPSLYGITNVFVLMPKSVLSLEKEELEMIIFHELLHYKKKHNLTFVFLKFLEDIHWFNPIIKIANSLIREDLEYLIDLDVINQNYNRITYSKTILKLIDCIEVSKMKMNFIPGICDDRKALERRILNMKNDKGNMKHAIIVVAAMIALISILTVSFASEKVKAPKVVLETNVAVEDENIISVVKPLDEIKITANFGDRMHPITGEVLTHRGIDLAAKEGTEIYTIMDGTVVFTNYETERGNTIRIKHENGYASTYAHGLEFLVEPGDVVKAGEPIMKVGTTGLATGPHLHLELENSEGELVDINKMFE